MNLLSYFFSTGPASGNWTGHYEQHGKCFSLKATLAHRGNKLSGQMIDLIGHHRQSLREMLEESGLSRTEIDEFTEEVRSHFPDSPAGEIEYQSILPEKSIVRGRIEGSQISFSKRYEGYMQIEYVLNDLALPQENVCELVQYTGEISSDFTTISGEWVIHPSHDEETSVSGTFQLNR